METENKNVEETTNVVEDNQENVNVETSNIVDDVVSAIKGLFPQEKKEEVKQEKKEEVKINAIDIEKIVQEKVNAQLDKMAKNTKQKAKEQAKNEIEQQEKEKNILEQITDEYKELVEFKMKKENFDVEEFLKETPQAKIKKSTTISTRSANINLDQSQNDYFAFINKKRK